MNDWSPVPSSGGVQGRGPGVTVRKCRKTVAFSDTPSISLLPALGPYYFCLKRYPGARSRPNYSFPDVARAEDYIRHACGEATTPIPPFASFHFWPFKTWSAWKIIGLLAFAFRAGRP
jgi:hypothetical protein